LARILSIEGERRRKLEDGWSFVIDEGGVWSHPDSIPGSALWRKTRVPGTIANALLEEGASYDDLPLLDSIDCWYRVSFLNEAPADLVFHGLATLAEVFLDGALTLSTASMFLVETITSIAPGRHDLHIRFRSVEREIESKIGRARWRPRMIVPSGLRHLRTTALGRLPGFAPPTPPLGPYRAVELIESGSLRISEASVRSSVEGVDVTLLVTLDVATPSLACPTLFCAGRTITFERQSETRLVADLFLPNCALWLPHTHGEPHLHAIRAEINGVAVDLGRTGFRKLRVDRGADGSDFAIAVNDTPVFCRGAVWTSADAHTLDGSRDACEPLLVAMRDASMNMVRVPGIALYESDDFYALCDELGLMIWQDFAFSNFDYPIDNREFRASVAREAAQFLSRVETSPALTTTCGGSEVYQQASMLGLAESKWRSPLFEEILPRATQKQRPDVIYVENSPSGGYLPFHADSGVSHYYGVGAYRRPFNDARYANVRFASECLGFSCVPEKISLARDFGTTPLSSPLWMSRIPRDMGAMQTFADVTEHYMRRLYGCEPEHLRENDPERYLDIARACVAETMAEIIGEWRRVGSGTRGALVWFLKDLWSSPGWGVIDANGEPKSAYYALKRAFRPVQIFLIDEGVNGLHLHLVNDSPENIEGEASLFCYRNGRTVVMRAMRNAAIPPRSAIVIRDVEFWGCFFDTTLAYNFGPPSHDATVASFRRMDKTEPCIEAFHFPLGRRIERAALSLDATVEFDGTNFDLLLTTTALAQSLCIEDASFRPADNWFHLAPGAHKRVRLTPRTKEAKRPHGVIRALNGENVSYESAPT
jgi:beta-mannosidase